MNKFSSVFGQILALFPRLEFEQEVRETGAEYRAKGFSSWDQFVAMLFCQMGQAHSLREICGGLASGLGKLKHLGVHQTPKRSTLSYANEHRSWELFQRLFYKLLEKSRSEATGRKRFRFKNKLLSLDATTIELCITLFDWARFRQTKGAVKLHLLLDHDGYLPTFAHVTEGNVHEINVAREIFFPKGSIVVFDRGYVDYAFLNQLNQRGVYFVIRAKESMVFGPTENRPIPSRGNILSDKVGELSWYYSERKYPEAIRRVVVWDEENQKKIVLLTNHMTFGPTTLARIYKERWQIEIFFKIIYVYGSSLLLNKWKGNG